MFENTRKHFQILRDAWAHDKEAAKTRTKRNDTDFLPASLEVIETPPNPAGRAFVWLLVTIFTVAMAWSWISHVDVVASAQGKTLPRERVKQVQSAEAGVVRTIYVENGQLVQEGDLLIELDPTIAEADVEQANQALTTAQTSWSLASALANYANSRDYAYKPPAGLPAADAALQRSLLSARIAEFEAGRVSLERSKEEAAAERVASMTEYSKLSETLPLIEEQLSARQELLDKGLSSKLLVLELRERVISHQKNLEIQEEQLSRANATIASIDAKIELHHQEFKKLVMQELADAQDEVTLRRAELDKALRRDALQQIRAPATGTVQQLSIHTVGGVVPAMEPLMVVVPENAELMVEAMVLNRDIGSVKVGDRVEVKLEAFPFTKHGVVSGRLENLSLDAVEDENLGLVYSARVALDTDTIQVNDQQVRLTSGMAITAEIKIGKRRLIEFVLSPLLRYRDEALRER